MGVWNARVHIYSATALGRGRMASAMLGRLYPRRKPRYSFYRRLGELQIQSATVLVIIFGLLNPLQRCLLLGNGLIHLARQVEKGKVRKKYTQTYVEALETNHQTSTKWNYFIP